MPWQPPRQNGPIERYMKLLEIDQQQFLDMVKDGNIGAVAAFTAEPIFAQLEYVEIHTSRLDR